MNRGTMMPERVTDEAWSGCGLGVIVGVRVGVMAARRRAVGVKGEKS